MRRRTVLLGRTSRWGGKRGKSDESVLRDERGAREGGAGARQVMRQTHTHSHRERERERETDPLRQRWREGESVHSGLQNV